MHFDPNWFFILGAWVSWGTYPVPFKSPAVVKADIDPFVFQFMKCICVFVTSFIVLTWREFDFTWWGLVGAALWVPAGLLFITAVKLTGVAFATPIANGVQVIVSFCWGAFFFHERVRDINLSVLAMFIMVVGMVGISFSVNYEKIIAARKKRQGINVDHNSEVYPILDGAEPYKTYKTREYDDTKDYGVVGGVVYTPVDDLPVPKSNERLRNIAGIICALGVGLFGGTQNVPLKHAPAKAHGIQYVISFGVGSVIVISVFTAIYIIIRLLTKRGLPKPNLKVSLLPGTIAGCLWAAGNFCNIYAVLIYGQTIGFPLVMCNMMVAGIWGVFYYREAPRLIMKALFVVSCLILLGGVALLSVYG